MDMIGPDEIWVFEFLNEAGKAIELWTAVPPPSGPLPEHWADSVHWFGRYVRADLIEKDRARDAD